MRLSVLGVVAVLTTLGATAPTQDNCDKYEYKNVCDHCPYDQHHPRELDLDDRDGGGRVCYKDCPKEYQQCKHYDYSSNNNDQEYTLDYQQDYTCPKNVKFKVVIKIEEISKERQLRVYYNDNGGSNHKRGISSSNLGIYTSPADTYNPGKLNYNQYCHGNWCGVPTKNLPPNLCGKEIWIAVGNNQCYDGYGHNDKGYKQATKYIKVKINCNQKNKPKCREYCCCPPRDKQHPK